MPELKACLDCGQRLSSQAKSCPNCKSPSPFGVKCYICKQLLPYKDRVTWHAARLPGHKSCVNERLRVPDKCHTCKDALPIPQWQGNNLLSVWLNEVCSSCGQPNPRNHAWDCSECYLPLFIGFEEYAERKKQGSPHIMQHFHRACVPPTRSVLGCASILAVFAALQSLVIFLTAMCSS
jgi:hypothetical protein